MEKVIKVRQKGQETCSDCFLSEFNTKMGVIFSSQLQFSDSKVRAKTEKLCAKAAKNKEMSERRKWLGAYYSKEILSGYIPDISIEWIDDILGYGVFAKSQLPARTFIGEYTGVVRKRRFFGDRKNDYCFDYVIGTERKGPYVIDAEKEGNHTRFVNHSDNPNLETDSVYCDGVLHIILFASKPIEKGTQLYYDYGPRYWKRREKPISR